MESNLSWLFYRDYFNEFFKSAGNYNTESIKIKAENILKYKCKIDDVSKIGNCELIFETTYPGLLIGSGYFHDLKNIAGQLSLGFHFDYTSGLPTIPSSSIKGVLRNAFKYPEYIKELIDNSFKIDSLKTEKEVLLKEIKELEKEIFEGNDIFFDAFITSSSSNKEFLSDDYITPHDNPIKNPVPIRFLKIKPNVKFLFQFKLFDGLIKKEIKLSLFKSILEDFGVGAKTNIGYGQFKFITKKFDENKIKIKEYYKNNNNNITQNNILDLNTKNTEIKEIFEKQNYNLGNIIGFLKTSNQIFNREIKDELLNELKFQLEKALNNSNLDKHKREKFKNHLDKNIPFLNNNL